MRRLWFVFLVCLFPTLLLAEGPIFTWIKVNGKLKAKRAILGGITYPTSDGSNGQVIVTDGAGNLSFASALTGVGYWTLNTGLLYPNTSYKVGIGTISPARVLHAHDPYGNYPARFSGLAQCHVEINANGYNQSGFRFGTGSKTMWYFDWYGNDASRRFRLRDSTGTSEVLTVLHGGNIGIGNTNPAYQLDITGQAKISGYAAIGGETPNSAISLLVGQIGSGGSGITVSRNYAGVTGMRAYNTTANGASIHQFQTNSLTWTIGSSHTNSEKFGISKNTGTNFQSNQPYLVIGTNGEIYKSGWSTPSDSILATRKYVTGKGYYSASDTTATLATQYDLTQVTGSADSTTWIATDYDVSLKANSAGNAVLSDTTATLATQYDLTQVTGSADSTTWIATDYDVSLKANSAGNAILSDTTATLATQYDISLKANSAGNAVLSDTTATLATKYDLTLVGGGDFSASDFADSLTSQGFTKSDTSSGELIATRYWVQSQGYGIGGGDITAATAGYGLDGGGIADSVHFVVDTTEIATAYDVSLKLDKTAFGDSLVNYDGYGIVITDNGDIRVDTSTIATVFDVSLCAPILGNAVMSDTVNWLATQYDISLKLNRLAFGDSLVNYDGAGLTITDNDAIDVNIAATVTDNETDSLPSSNAVYDFCETTQNYVTTSETSAWDKTASDDQLKADFGDSLVNYDGAGLTITNNSAINVNIAATVTDSETDSLPSSNAVYDFVKSTVDTVREVKTWFIDSPLSALSDTLWLHHNLIGETMTIEKIAVRSDLDSINFIFVYTSEGGTGSGRVDSVANVTEGGSMWYGSSTSFDQADIADNSQLGLVRLDDNCDFVAITVRFRYLRGL